MHRTLCCLATIIGLAACSSSGSSRPASTTTEKGSDPHSFNPCAANVAGAVDCSEWPQWVKVNEKRFRSRGHGKKWVDVYVTPEHAAAYQALKDGVTFPVGARVVKAQYDTETAAKPGSLTVMGKMKPGYDAEHKDWYYGVYDPSGTRAIMAGKLQKCIGCHEQSADTDYLSGVPAE